MIGFTAGSPAAALSSALPMTKQSPTQTGAADADLSVGSLSMPTRQNLQAVFEHRVGDVRRRLGLAPERLLSARAPGVRYNRSIVEGDIDEMVASFDGELDAELTRAGASPRLIKLVRAMVDVRVEANAVVMQSRFGEWIGQTEVARHLRVQDAQAPTAPDVIELWSAADLARHMHLSEDAVRAREARRELFGYLPGDRKRGRVYPSFQVWETIKGEPLHQILKALGDEPASSDATFFTSVNRELGGLTPIEALVGSLSVERAFEEDVTSLLLATSEDRLRAVIEAAEAFVAAAA